MRGLFLIISLLLAPLTSACDPARDQRCESAFEHLSSLVKHTPSPEVHENFIKACGEAWDDSRMTCLINSQSATEALACQRSVRRPK